MNNIKLLQLNSYVYVITYVDGMPYCITKDRVYMKSATEFITEDMISDSVINEYRYPLNANNYGRRWTKTLKEAKESVNKYFQEEKQYFGNEIQYTITKNTNESWSVNM